MFMKFCQFSGNQGCEFFVLLVIIGLTKVCNCGKLIKD